MLSGGKKYEKPKKTKFHKNREQFEHQHIKNQKHRDKSTYRLLRQEKIMSYRDQIKKRIAELEAKIAESNVDKLQLDNLRSELARLNMQDFEEDLRTEGSQQLLKG